MPRAALLDEISEPAFQLFDEAGFEIDDFPRNIDTEKLVNLAGRAAVLGVRTSPEITDPRLFAGDELLAVGVFSIGTGHVDKLEAAENGIAVINNLYGNARSVAEHVILSAGLLLRGTLPQDTQMHQGEWKKTMGHEMMGKTIGILGFGNIGRQVAQLARPLEMDVVYYDLLPQPEPVRATRCDSLEELLSAADVLSVHVDGNRQIIGARELALMKPGSYVINTARGPVVDEQALALAIGSSQIAGAAIDVFAAEPPAKAFTSPLRGLPNVFLTPHIGGNTVEAQDRIATDTAKQVLKYLDTGNSTGSVSIPELKFLGEIAAPSTARLLYVHKDKPGAVDVVTTILAGDEINVNKDVLETNGQHGYAAYDLSQPLSKTAMEAINAHEHTIKARQITANEI